MNWANFTKVKTFFAENWKILFAIASAFSAGGGTVHAKHVIKRRLLKCPSCNYIGKYLIKINNVYFGAIYAYRLYFHAICLYILM